MVDRLNHRIDDDEQAGPDRGRESQPMSEAPRACQPGDERRRDLDEPDHSDGGRHCRC